MSTTEPMSPRQILAFVAMAAAPVPTQIDLRAGAEVELTFMGPGAFASLRAWMKLLGATDGELSGPNRSGDGKFLLSHCLRAGEIGGHRVVLWAHEPAGPTVDEPVPAEVREQLQQLVDEPVDGAP